MHGQQNVKHLLTCCVKVWDLRFLLLCNWKVLKCGAAEG